MEKHEFEQFVLEHGKDILRFCRLQANNTDIGNELYQDTMLKLLEKRKKIKLNQNAKSYALSVSILLWKNRKKKYANRKRLVNMCSLEEMSETDGDTIEDDKTSTPEQTFQKKDERNEVQRLIQDLPEKNRVPLLLYYSAQMKVEEIAQVLKLPEGTVKSRLRKAKQIMKEKLEALGYE